MLTGEQTKKWLDKLCVELGFCLPPDASLRLSNAPPREVTAFVDAVFTAKGLDPFTADRHLYRQVRNLVAAAFRAAGA